MYVRTIRNPKITTILQRRSDTIISVAKFKTVIAYVQLDQMYCNCRLERQKDAYTYTYQLIIFYIVGF